MSEAHKSDDRLINLKNLSSESKVKKKPYNLRRKGVTYFVTRTFDGDHSPFEPGHDALPSGRHLEVERVVLHRLDGAHEAGDALEDVLNPLRVAGDGLQLRTEDVVELQEHLGGQW